MSVHAVLPRQLSLDGFSETLETTRATDDAVLRAAIRRLFQMPDFLAMTRATQEVLIALLARRNFKDPALIHPSAYNQAFIATAAGVSRSSVKRAYAVLEERGWLVREDQGYDARRRRYQGTPIRFSAMFVEQARLARTFDSAAREIAPRPPQSLFDQTHSPVVQNEPLIKEDSLEQSSSKRQSHNRPAVHKPVPRELFCLIEKGLSCWTVFWLMRLAGKSNKRLSDIVEAKRAAIEKRRGRMLVGFLQHLIRQDVDYAWQKRELDAAAVEQAAAHRGEQQLEALVDTLVCVDGGAQAIRIRQRSSGFHGELVGASGSVPHAELLKLVRAGRLGAWRHTEKIAPDAIAAASVQQGARAAAHEALDRIRSLMGVR
jgi:DNA-binding MarR family transcriptional regulator